jgi:hypothetical protein
MSSRIHSALKFNLSNLKEIKNRRKFRITLKAKKERIKRKRKIKKIRKRKTRRRGESPMKKMKTPSQSLMRTTTKRGRCTKTSQSI